MPRAIYPDGKSQHYEPLPVKRDGSPETDPLKYIRTKCIDCSGGSAKEVEMCPIKECALYPMRLGKNPFRKRRSLTEEQKAAVAKRLAEARKKADSAS